MKPEELRPVKIGYQDGLGNVESVEAYTADQLADSLEAAMEAARKYWAHGIDGDDYLKWNAKISDLRSK